MIGLEGDMIAKTDILSVIFKVNELRKLKRPPDVRDKPGFLAPNTYSYSSVLFEDQESQSVMKI